MAKTKISEFSATPASNTDIDSINIAEGCAPSGINDAIRELMSQLKDWQAGTSNDPMVIGSSGSLTLSYGTANGVPYLNGSKVLTSGSALVFDGTNLGIGTSSPAVKLHSYTSGNTPILSETSGGVTSYLGLKNTGGMAYIASQNNNILFATSNNADTRATLDSSGNLGLGVTPSAWSLGKAFEIAVAGAGLLGNGNQLTISKNAYFNSGWKYARTGDNALQYDMNGGTHAWYTAPSGTAGNAISFTQAMALDASGNLLVGKITNDDTSQNGLRLVGTGSITSTMQVSTNADFSYVLYSKGAAAYRFYVGLGGTVYATSTTISAISDIRFKENVRDLDAGLDKIMALKPRLYDWKEGKGADIKNARGFIAQEFETVFPDLVDEWKDPAPEGEEPYKSVRQDLIPVLVKAIQELKAIIDAQAARITALEGTQP